MTMKPIKEKIKRTVKYWRVSYQQANGRDRLLLGIYALMVLVYAWLIMLRFLISPIPSTFLTKVHNGSLTGMPQAEV